MGMVFNFGHTYLFFEGNVKEAQRRYAETLALCQLAGSTTLSLRAMMGLAQAQQVGGHLHQAYETCRQGLELAKTTEQEYGRGLPAIAWVQVVEGDLLREWNRLDEAADCLAQCIELCRRWKVGDVLCASYLFQARLRLAQRDMAGAAESIRQAEQLPQAYQDVPWAGGPISTCRVRFALAQARLNTDSLTADSAFDSGALAPVEKWVAESGMGVDGSVSSLNEESAYLIWARLLIAQNKGDRALQLLERLYQAAEDGGRTGRVIEVLALRALALHTLGESEKALIALKQALLPAEPEGYIRVFVDEGIPMAELLRRAASFGVAPDYVSRLLAAFAIETKYLSPAAGPSPSSAVLGPSSPILSDAEGLLEPLSNRELDVLRLVAAGLTNRAIAQELSIAVSTVKTHMKNIHAKLGVLNRTQAVARARKLDLLP
jgi:LuxR family maltose regulon positive regulatory protein